MKGPGTMPWMMKAPISRAAAMLPGMPSAMVGTRFAPTTALFAASVAMMPCGLPRPKLCGSFEARRAAP